MVMGVLADSADSITFALVVAAALLVSDSLLASSTIDNCFCCVELRCYCRLGADFACV